MKKLNLIKRLWTDSHEKQSPQRFGRYAAMLIMLLTLGVGQMWAVPGFNQGNIYFDKSGWTTNSTYIYFVVGKQKWEDNYSSVYLLNTTISNTQLVKGWCSNNGWWNGMTHFGVIGSGSTVNSGSWDPTNLTAYSHYTGNNNSVDINNSEHPFLCTKASASNGAALTISEKDDLSGLNYTLTMKYAVSTNGGTATELTSGYVPATLTCSTYKFVSAYDEVSSSSLANTLTKNGSRYSSTASAAHTASTTFAVSSIDDDYTFLGWYTAADGGTELSTNTSYTTYLPTANATIYARFSHENKHTVTINRYCTSTSSLINSTSQKVGEITYSEISAPVISGYTFANWSYENGISVKSGDKTSSNPIHVKTLSSGTYTLTANYTEDLTSPWTLKGGTNLTGDDWSISHAMTKKTGHSTESVAYYTLNITSTNSGVSTGTASWSFKLYNSGWYGLFASGESYWWTSSTSANQSMNGSDKNIQVCANALGEYEVKVDWSSGNKVTVSFPTSYAVNFGKGGTSGSSTVTAKYSNVAFSTGTKVQSGKKVVFTYSEATGYHFVEWNSQSDGNGSSLGTAASYEYTVGTSNNVYAIFAPNTWTVTLDAEGGTAYGITESVSVTYNATTNLTSAITKPSTHPAFSTFGGYWTGRGGTGVQLIDKDGNWIKDVASYTGHSSTNPTWIYNNNITLYAKWTLYYSLHHSPNLTNTPESSGSVTVTYKSSTLTSFTASSRSGYECQGYYTTTNAAGGGQKVITSGGALFNTNGASDTIVDTSNKWIYATRRINGGYLYPHWTANTYTVTFDPDDDDRVGDATNVQDVVSVTFNTNDYHVGETPVSTVKVPVLDGYTFGGYYTVKNGGGAQIVDADGVWQASKTYYTDGSKNWIKADNVTLYAKWTAKTYTLTLDAGTNGGHILGALGDATSETVEITMGENYPLVGKSGWRSGYEFQGWYTDPSGGTLVTKDTRVATALDHTLYAHYLERNYVYFYNNLGWEHVYVTYSAYWADDTDKGTGNNGKVYREMTLVEGTTNIYRDEIPSSIIDNWSGTNGWIAFDNHGFSAIDGVGNFGNFDEGKVIHRRDFDSYATMFVPNSSATKDYTKNAHDAKPGADYYCTGLTADQTNKDYRYIDKGYWTRYGNNLYSGYVLKGSWDGDHDYYFTRTYTDHVDTTTVVLHLAASRNYTFKVYKHCRTTNYNNSWFSKSASPYTITSAACKDVVFNTAHAGNYIGAGNDKDVTITTTDEGDYTFKLITDKTGVLKLTVAYPKAPEVRDHRLVYTWTPKGGSAHTWISPRKLIPNTARTPMSAFIHKPSNVTSNSLKLQRWNGSAWVDAHTFTLTDELIPNNGVYYIEPNREGGTIKDVKVEPYTGKYYIRTDASSGGWKDYSNISFGDNSLTYSAYSLTQTLSDPYSHFHCIYVDNTSTSVAFTVATEWTPSISDTLKTDALVTGSNCHLPEAANVRFMWNSETNELHRAYLKSAQGENARFLVLHGKADDMIFDEDGDAIPASSPLAKNEIQFVDKGDWIYEIDLQAKPGALACITAKFDGADRYLIGNGTDKWETVLGGSGTTKYPMKGIYDFKTNRLMMMWTPPVGAITDDLQDVDMLWIRNGENSASQINITTGSLKDVTVVGALEFKYNDLIGKVSEWNSYSRPLMKFMLSFPFDVNVSDIFGLNGAEYGREYIIQTYNGARRAEKGYYSLDGDFWEDLTVDSVMHANQGYSVIMDNDYMNNASKSIWEHKSAGSSIYLYFPATKKMDIPKNEETSIVKPHLSFDKEFGSGKNHLQTDSHWNMIGSPLFHDSYVKASTNAESKQLAAYYEWDSSDNSWGAEVDELINPKDLDGKVGFPAMSSFIVQWYGTITWSTTATDYSPAAAPRKTTEEEKNYLAQLDLIYNDNVTDKAYVQLSEDATEGYSLCEDLNKIMNGNKSNIYLFADSYEVAYSQVPVQNDTIPVGLRIRRNGTYTFSMPTEFSGTVTLIDNFDGTRTNLTYEDYTVDLEKGTIDDRFELEINISKIPTAIDGAEDGSGSLKDGKAHKFIENGVMYILNDGVLYDATGKRVK